MTASASKDRTGTSGIPRLPLQYVTEGYGPAPPDQPVRGRPTNDQQPRADGEVAPGDRIGTSGIPRGPLQYVTEGYGPKPSD